MGWPEVILILVVLLVIFGAGKLPQIGSAIGGGIRELRQGADGSKDDDSAADPPADADAAPSSSEGAPR
ncbi:MAG: twin-arginine translocase TatA/TatE family subunit [Chloroflexota bacterium]|nr:twin-arginine translocase TatA/TatE family subunit [Chloroflexota bacterium]